MTHRSQRQEEIASYRKLALNVRKEILDLIYRTRSPHIGPSLSIVEILIALYFKILSIDPQNPRWCARDRFILSKGHACPALYAVLLYKNLVRPEFLAGFAVDGGTLEHHPRRDLDIGIEVSTGSLGHGLSIGSGMALAAKHDDSAYRVFVLLGDGETNEGDVWESVMFASHHNLDNLIAIVDYNKIQALGRTREVLDLDPLVDKWRSFGWVGTEVDGHSFEQLLAAFEGIPFQEGRPSVVIAHTIKGKGVSFMEDKPLWHYRCPDEQEYARALKELA